VRPFRFIAAAAASLACLVASPHAHANGRFPASSALVARPGAPDELLLRTTFGVLSSRDGGTTWHWVCEAAIGYGGVQDPTLGFLADGTVLAGLFEGLSVSRDGGCDYRFAGAPLERETILDLTVPASAPNDVYLLTGTYAGEVDGGSRYRNRLFVSRDGAKTFAPLSPPFDPFALVETLEVSASRPSRIYVTTVRGFGAETTAQLFVSDDGGESFVERAVPLDLTRERSVFIAAIDPNAPDRVYLRTSGQASSRLLVTDDAGLTFRETWSGAPMLGFALSPDGEKVFVGSAKDGLWAASTSELRFEKRSDIQVQCLLHLGGSRLLACSNEVSGFIFGASDDDGRTFAPKLRLNGIRGPLACDPSASAAVCLQEWPTIREQLGGSAEEDDGGARPRPDAGPGVDPVDGGTNTPCRACAVGSTRTMIAGSAGALLAFAAFLLRRRARGAPRV
jgi:hypothetical protein